MKVVGQAWLVTFAMVFLSACKTASTDGARHASVLREGDSGPSMLSLDDSPFKDIKVIDFEKIRMELDAAFTDTATSNAPYRAINERLAWAETRAQSDPQIVQVLDVQGATGAQAVVDILASDDEDAKAEIRLRLSDAKIAMLGTKVANKLFAYRIFNGTSVGKKDILIWANEHSNEVDTADFLN